MTEDRRRYERIEIELPVRLYIPGSGSALRFEAYASSLDLGLGGLFVKSSFLLRSGVELVVELRLPDGPLPMRGVVSHVVGPDDRTGPSGMGIEFLAVETHSRERLLRFFAPDRYHRFFGEMIAEFPHLERELPLADVALVLNLWEEWKLHGEATTRSQAAAAAKDRAPRRGGRHR